MNRKITGKNRPITSMTKHDKKSTHRRNTAHTTRQKREHADVQNTIYGKGHMKASCGTTEGAHTQSYITGSHVYPAEVYRKLRCAKQTSLISWPLLSSANNQS